MEISKSTLAVTLWLALGALWVSAAPAPEPVAAENPSASETDPAG